MNLHISRKYGAGSTEGELLINGIYECYTLELARLFEGKENVPKHCCIPEGVFDLELYDSPHNKCDVLRLKNVPGRSEIEIHVANQPAELLGCIAVGWTHGPDWVGTSRRAFEALMQKVSPVIKAGEKVTIQITGGLGEA